MIHNFLTSFNFLYNADQGTEPSYDPNKPFEPLKLFKPFKLLNAYSALALHPCNPIGLFRYSIISY